MPRLPVRSRLATDVLAVTAAFLVAGCGGLPNPLATPVPPDVLQPRPPEPAQVAPTPEPPADLITELRLQRAKWERAGITEYRMRMIFGCQCPLAGRTVDVRVRDGRIIDAALDKEPMEIEDFTGLPATVDRLFDYAEQHAGAGKEELQYDPVLGYPLALGIDADLNALDDSVRVAVLELVPIP